MQQLLIIFLFLTGVTPLDHHKYYLILESRSWIDAQTYCRAHHVDLAIITSDEDLIKLQAEAQTQHFTSQAWFGLYKVSHDWRWTYGNESLETTYWNYEPNPDGDRDCAVIRSDGLWVNYPCDRDYQFICYDERNTGGSRYIYIPERLSWFGAQSYCRMYHTDLATARDKDENSVIVPIMESSYSWIALSRITWTWVDDSIPTNISWESGEPDNYGSDENCGYLYNFKAADDGCLSKKRYFCYRIITGQIQTVRFKVESDQNLNDPVVKAALLEKILQKLMDHGMDQNIRLKWTK